MFVTKLVHGGRDDIIAASDSSISSISSDDIRSKQAVSRENCHTTQVVSTTTTSCSGIGALSLSFLLSFAIPSCIASDATAMATQIQFVSGSLRMIAPQVSKKVPRGMPLSPKKWRIWEVQMRKAAAVVMADIVGSERISTTTPKWHTHIVR